jgi:hypothetical protein
VADLGGADALTHTNDLSRAIRTHNDIRLYWKWISPAQDREFPEIPANSPANALVLVDSVREPLPPPEATNLRDPRQSLPDSTSSD